MLEVAVDEVVDMVAVRHRFVAAHVIGSMATADVARGADGRDRGRARARARRVPRVSRVLALHRPVGSGWIRSQRSA